MAFYIKPPKGNIPLDKLFHFGEKRLRFLCDLCSTSKDKLQDLIQRAELLEKNDCLIEGTTKDKISHFLLKLICMEKREMQEFFIHSETILFNLRLQFYDLGNIRKTLQIASCEILDILSTPSFVCMPYKQFLLTLVSVKEQLEILIKDSSIPQEINVPFIHALDFVKERLAPVRHGYVILKVHQIKSLLTILFEQSLIEGFVQLRSSACKGYIEEDLRIRNVCCRLQVLFTKLNQKPTKLVSSSRKILHSELDHVSKDFPLCMRHLHNVLRQRHRLKHKSRVQYTLFLKEIGVPCEEVIKLFEAEYSQAPQNGEKHSTCLHSWHKDRSHYIYNIRHLYGKEGSCNKYRGHSCHTLQFSDTTASEEGGCPFAHFDKKYLQDLLRSFGAEVCDIEDLVNLSSERKYRSACTSYLLDELKKQAGQRTLLVGNSDVEKNVSNFSQTQLIHLPISCMQSNVAVNEISTPYKVAKNRNVIHANQKNMSSSNEFFMSLSDLIIHPSDFYRVCSNDVWMKLS